jgi:hypothetical protein
MNLFAHLDDMMPAFFFCYEVKSQFSAEFRIATTAE